MTRQSRQQQEGAALLIAMIVIVAIGLVLGGLSSQMVGHMRQVDHFAGFERAFDGVEFAVAQSRANLEVGGSGRIGLGQWQAPATGDNVSQQSGKKSAIRLPSFGDPGLAPLKMPGATSVEYLAFVSDWSADHVDNNGDRIVDGPEEAGMYCIYALARCQGVVRCAEVVLRKTRGADSVRGFSQISWREIGH